MKLGLIGQHIHKSRAKSLHESLGRKYKLDLTYQVFDRELAGKSGLDEMLSRLAEEGFRGVNITHPYKVHAWDLVRRREAADPALGALNTVVLNEGERRGTNTDCTGFSRVLSGHLANGPTGRVFLMGAGGVGRAIAFGLGRARAEHIHIYDGSEENLSHLVAALEQAGYSASAVPGESVEECLRLCDGLINATPVGHHSCPGSLFPPPVMAARQWVFDCGLYSHGDSFPGGREEGGVPGHIGV